jgi:hypothetical protein
LNPCIALLDLWQNPIKVVLQSLQAAITPEPQYAGGDKHGHGQQDQQRAKFVAGHGAATL